MLGFVGATCIDASVAEVTVRAVLLDMPPSVAVIAVNPTSAEVASPWEPDALLILATTAFEVLQVTDAVISWFVLSE
jgi:hypothetical protein